MVKNLSSFFLACFSFCFKKKRSCERIKELLEEKKKQKKIDLDSKTLPRGGKHEAMGIPQRSSCGLPGCRRNL